MIRPAIHQPASDPRGAAMNADGLWRIEKLACVDRLAASGASQRAREPIDAMLPSNRRQEVRTADKPRQIASSAIYIETDRPPARYGLVITTIREITSPRPGRA